MYYIDLNNYKVYFFKGFSLKIKLLNEAYEINLDMESNVIKYP